jgi:hypothetical protein
MGPKDQDVERLLHLLEEVRRLLVSSLPPAPSRKKLSWEEVWRVSPYVSKTNAQKVQAYQLS